MSVQYKSRAGAPRAKILNICAAVSLTVTFACLLILTLVSLRYIETEMRDQALLGIGLTAVALLAAAVLIGQVVFRMTILWPVQDSTQALRALSDDSGDLTRRLPEGGGELGELAAAFNAASARIRDVIDTMENEVKALQGKSGNLTTFITETAASIHHITGVVTGVRERAQNQSASVTETNAAMEQIGMNIDNLKGQVEQQAASVSQSSSAVEQMLANIQSVTQTLVQNDQNVRDLLDSSGKGRAGLEEVVSGIQEIARESDGLLEINAVMQTIASQTNLLAMNAAIEAAHAGESGKGFAVVADEIRKLAESSGAQSKTISTELKKIKDAIDQISRRTGVALGQFAAVVSGVQTVAEQEEHIRGAMEEQSEGSRQILDAVSRLNELTRQVRDGSEEMLKQSRQVIQGSRHLGSLTAEITEGMTGMSVETEKINGAIGQAVEMSALNQENLRELEAISARFTTGDSGVYRWDSSLKTGNELIDGEHKQLIAAINAFLEISSRRDNAEELRKTLHFLMDYTAKHFSDEEALQQKYRYPQYHTHKQFHEYYKGVVRDIMMAFFRDGATDELIAKAKKEIGDAIIVHIKSEDARLAAHIKRSAG